MERTIIEGILRIGYLSSGQPLKHLISGFTPTRVICKSLNINKQLYCLFCLAGLMVLYCGKLLATVSDNNGGQLN